MPTLEELGKWRQPKGAWSILKEGLLLPPTTTLVKPGELYVVETKTLCGNEDINIEAQPFKESTAAQFARQCQIVASIQHVVRRACRECRSAYQTDITPFERSWLFAYDPMLGPILGVASKVRSGDNSDAERAKDIEKQATLAAQRSKKASILDAAGKPTNRGD